MSMETFSKQNIYLVRHGKPLLPHERMYYGSTDYPLSDEGTAQARALAGIFSRMEFARVYSSPMSRALDTAKIITGKSAEEMTLVPELREIDLGNWEGKTFDEVRGEWNEIYEARGHNFANVAPPNGENFSDLQKRAVPAFERILGECPKGDILVVAHGGVIWSLMCKLFGYDLNDIFFYLMDYCGVHKLQRTDGLTRLEKYNWSPVLG